MLKFTDTQTIILSRAATRPDNLAMPLPKGLNQTGFTGGHKAWKISHDQRKFRKPFFDGSAGARSAFGA